MKRVWTDKDASGLAFSSENFNFNDVKLGDDDLLVCLQPLTPLSKWW